MSASSPLPSPTFPLRGDFHLEIGWSEFVRNAATRDPDAIREIMASSLSGDIGPDPLSVLERWEPISGCFMFYFWMIRQGQTSPSLIVTDGPFSMAIDPLPCEEHLLGLPSFLADLANDAARATGGALVVPVLDRAGIPASSDIFPANMIIHRYNDTSAYLAPCRETLVALRNNPGAWLEASTVRDRSQS